MAKLDLKELGISEERFTRFSFKTLTKVYLEFRNQPGSELNESELLLNSTLDFQILFLLIFLLEFYFHFHTRVNHTCIFFHS